MYIGVETERGVHTSLVPALFLTWDNVILIPASIPKDFPCLHLVWGRFPRGHGLVEKHVIPYVSYVLSLY